MSKHIIVRIKNNVPHKYGVLNNEPHDGENTICYWYGESTISRDRFDIVTQPDFDYIEVYRANKWEESLWNTSIYMDLGTSYKCEMAYKKLYKLGGRY